MSEDCYFFWDDDDVLYEDRKVYMQCMRCYNDKDKPNYRKGIMWSAKGGYPNIEIRCNCGEIIHSPKQDEDEIFF